jgi:hypothetical protein
MDITGIFWTFTSDLLQYDYEILKDMPSYKMLSEIVSCSQHVKYSCHDLGLYDAAILHCFIQTRTKKYYDMPRYTTEWLFFDDLHSFLYFLVEFFKWREDPRAEFISNVLRIMEEWVEVEDMNELLDNLSI